MVSEENHMEAATEGESDDGDSDNESDEEETVSVGGVLYQVGKKRKRDNGPLYNGDTITMGQEITVADLKWKRIPDLPEDVRTEPHLPTTFKTNLFNHATRECDVFEALLPLSKDVLLQIFRENSEELNDGRTYQMWMIEATIAIVLGGAQFKEGTDLWATKNMWLMPPLILKAFVSR
jgi:hypothetical protein